MTCHHNQAIISKWIYKTGCQHLKSVIFPGYNLFLLLLLLVLY